MTLRIESRELGDGYVEAYFTNDPSAALMVIQEGLPEETRRAREIEAHGYCVKPPPTGKKVCLAVTSLEALDQEAIDAMALVVGKHLSHYEMERVKAAWSSAESRDALWMAFECKMHVHTVLAAIRYLSAQGALPTASVVESDAS